MTYVPAMKLAPGKKFKQWLLYATLFNIYFVIGELAIRIHAFIGYHPMVWFPAGLGLGILVIGGEALWPVIFLSATCLSASVGMSFVLSCLLGFSTTLGNVLGARILKTICAGRTPKLDNVTEAFLYAVLVIGVSSFISTAIASGSMILMTGISVEKYFFIWKIWWFSEAMGILIVGTAIICLTNDIRFQLHRYRRKEYFTLLAAITLATIFIYTPLSKYNQSLLIRPYLLFPLMIWAALRFDTLGVVTVNIVIMFSMLTGALNGVLPPGTGSVDDRMLIHQLVAMTIGLTGLALSAVVREKNTVTKELIAAKEAAEAANIAKSAFLANMSHEIRTPLGAILGFADLVTDVAVEPTERGNYVSAIRRNSELLSGIINDILDLSKIEAGKIELNLRPVELYEILSETKPLLEFLAKQKGIDFNLKVDQEVPAMITTDPLRLRQVLINIGGNAIKFTSRGSVNVHVQYDPNRFGAGQLAFEVTDTGCGIDQDQVQKLFAPFSQVDVTLKRKFGGTGLGLYLSKRIVGLLGGSLTLVRSEPNEGSTFLFKIDLGLHSSVVTEKKTKAEISTGIRLDGVRVLLADDAVDNQFLISHILKLAGAEVSIVSNGQEAVDKAKADKFDVLLMDIQMPNMDGCEATTQLRKEGYDGKIVALTAYALTEERERFLKSGFDDYISKPIQRNLLIERVSSFARELS